MSITVIAMSLTFIILTLPNAIAGGYFIGELFSTYNGRVILIFSGCFNFTFHGFNFVVLLISNKNFRKEFKEFVSEKMCCKTRVIPIESTRTKTKND